MLEHNFRTPANCRCEDPRFCPVCEGGLKHCRTCGGAEGSLPTECPGVRMTEQQETEVYARELDFIDGAWKVTIPIRT